MIELNAKIKVLEKSQIELGENSIIYPNNISTAPPLNNFNVCKNPFILGVNKFGDGSALFSNVNYYIHKYLSSENYDVFYEPNERFEIPNYPQLYIISQGECKSLSFVFDTYNNIYPKAIYVNNQSQLINSPICTIINPQPYSISGDIYTYYVYFTHLNKPKRPLVITGIYSGEEIELNKKNTISISRTISDRADFKFPSFGIISNIGEIEFNDYNGKVLEYANSSLLKEGLECRLYLKNSLNNTEQEVGLFQTSNWNYNNDNRKVSVSLKDDLEEWQDINIEGFSYDAKNRPEYNLSWFYNYLHDKTPSKYKMLAFEELDTKTQDILNNITIKYPILKSASLWQQWTKLCQVSQSHIYKLDNGSTTFFYKGGN